MGKEMILTILVISVTLGAVTELQIVPVQLGPSAHSTFVHRLSAVSGLCGVHLAFEILLSPDLLRRNSAVIASHQEEDDEIQQRSNDRHFTDPAALHEGIYDEKAVQDTHPFHLDRDEKVQHDLHIRITYSKSEEDRHINIVGTEKSIAEKHVSSENRIEEKSAQNRRDHSHENVDVVTESSPGLFQTVSKRIIEKQHNDGKNTR